MSKPARNYLYALICFGLIGAVYVWLPASFYTLTALLLLFALFYGIRGLRAG